jgi:hypothetical protein
MHLFRSDKESNVGAWCVLVHATVIATWMLFSNAAGEHKPAFKRDAMETNAYIRILHVKNGQMKVKTMHKKCICQKRTSS